MAAVSAVNLIIHKGTTFEETFTFSGEDGGILNFSGSTATSKLKKHPSAGIAYTFSTTTTIANGTIKISMTPDKTSQLPTGRCYYDVTVTYYNGLTSKLVEGNVFVQETASL